MQDPTDPRAGSGADPCLPPLESIFERAPLGLGVIARDGRVVMANPALGEMLGYEVDELVGTHASELIAPAEREDAMAVMERVLRGEVDSTREVRPYARRDGATVCARIFTAAVRDEDGQVVGLVAQAEDVTAEREAASAQAQLATLIAALGEAVITTDGDQVITSWNPAAESLLGWSAEDVIGKPLSMYVPEGRATEQSAFIEQLMAGKTVRADTERLRQDGSTVPVRVVISPVLDDGGRVEAAIGVMHDIREEAETRRRLAHLAGHDPVTELPNRRQVGERLERACERSRATGALTGVLFVDLDEFKQVNDRHGHDTGDEYLRVVGARLRGALRPGDLLGRWGGDEYVAVLEGAGTAQDVTSVAQRFLEALDGPIRIGDLRIPVAASVGVACTDGNASAQELLRSADAAMYRAKSRGGGQVAGVSAAS